MSAAEIIEQIKQLPPEEFAIVKAFLSSDEFNVDDVGRIEFKQAAKEVFTEHDSLFRRLAEYERKSDSPPR